MTTPDTPPEHACATCDDTRVVFKSRSRPCPDCRPTEPAEGGQSTRIIPARSDQPPTEASETIEKVMLGLRSAPAPAAPSVLEALRTILELIGIDDSEAAWRDATAAGWEAVAAARVPGGAAGEALEAARAAILGSGEWTDGEPWTVDLNSLTTLVDELIAAARAPGPVGGEALEELRGWYEQLIGDRRPDTPLPWRTSEAGTMLVDAHNPDGVPLAVQMDPANAEFVARALMFVAAAARVLSPAPAEPGGG